MPYVSDTQLADLLHLPVSFPLTEVEPSRWVVISSVLLQQGQSFTLRMLQMNLLSLADPLSGADTLITSPTADGTCVFPSGNANLLTAGYGLAYLGLYLNFNALVSPASQAATRCGARSNASFSAARRRRRERRQPKPGCTWATRWLCPGTWRTASWQVPSRRSSRRCQSVGSLLRNGLCMH